MRLKINGWVNVSFCLPHKVHYLNQGTIHIKVWNTLRKFGFGFVNGIFNGYVIWSNVDFACNGIFVCLIKLELSNEMLLWASKV